MGEERADNFGARLRELREAAGLTQELLAERAGLSANAVGALERGERRRPYRHTIQALAEALGLSAEEGAALAETVPPLERTPSPALERDPASSVPTPPTRLVGREHDAAAVIERLTGSAPRLVTLTGPGGVGKTRLALQVAAEVAEDFPDGIAFVSLAPLAEAALVVPTIAAALGLREAGGQDLGDALRAFLRTRRLLLVLDNVEHVLQAAPDVAHLLAACPELRVLATSRAPLHVRGEQEYPVQPLSLPDLSRVPTPEEAATSPAVQLFVERAREIMPGFALSRANAAAVAAICRRLDGLPLALELAAARLRLLNPTELLARLDQSLPVLTGGARDLPERQQTMRQTIAWSYALLSVAEQALFRRLSVFAGGWDASAVEVIGAGAVLDGADTLDVLMGLVEHSLVLAESLDDGTTRYRMLETIRQFGLEQLAAAGEAGAVRDAHAAWYVTLAEAAEPELRGAEQGTWLRRLEMEHGNFRAAMEWALQAPMLQARELGVRLAGALWGFWFVRGHFAEGWGWLERLLAATDDCPTAARAKALFAAGMLAFRRADPATSAARYAASLAMARAIGNQTLEARARFGLGDATRMHGQHAEATQHYEAALSLFRALGDRAWTGMTLNGLALAALQRGALDQAARLVDEALGLLTEAGDAWSMAVTTAIVADTAWLRRDAPQAAALYAQAITAWWGQGDRYTTAIILERISVVAVAQGWTEEAARLAGASAAARAAIRTDGGNKPQATREGASAVAEARQTLGETAFEQAWATGQTLSLEMAIAEALALAERLAAEPAALASRSVAYPAGLSEREVEVLRLVATGMTNAQVADRLYLSRRTVDAHLRRIYDKLDLASRTEAIRFAIEQGLA